MPDTHNYAVTITDTGMFAGHLPYKRTVAASTIKPGDAVKQVLDMIEDEEDHWLWKAGGLRIEVEQVS
jgi:hypothetical protein